MNDPTFSVIIPTFNRPEGLRRTLECIRNQTYRNLEILVSDNCSDTTETRAVALAHQQSDSRVRYHRQERNIGLEANFKLVRKRFGATCHVRELDAKDYPFPKLIELLVKSDYEGWVLNEASSKPADRIAALAAQRKQFDELVKKATG